MNNILFIIRLALDRTARTTAQQIHPLLQYQEPKLYALNQFNNHLEDKHVKTNLDYIYFNLSRLCCR